MASSGPGVQKRDFDGPDPVGRSKSVRISTDALPPPHDAESHATLNVHEDPRSKRRSRTKPSVMVNDTPLRRWLNANKHDLSVPLVIGAAHPIQKEHRSSGPSQPSLIASNARRNSDTPMHNTLPSLGSSTTQSDSDKHTQPSERELPFTAERSPLSSESAPTPERQAPPDHADDGDNAHQRTMVTRQSKMVEISGLPQGSNERLHSRANGRVSTGDQITDESTPGSDATTQPSFERRKLKTGYVYDIIMTYHATLDPQEFHPEDPRRILCIYNALKEKGLLSECARIPIRRATRQEIQRVHVGLYYKTMRLTRGMMRQELERMERNYNSIYLNGHSFESSLYAAGGVIEACKAVATDQVKNAFAIVRPPGHHAEIDTAMGFCLFNNVAIATRYTFENIPSVRRIMILDWDIHFGNGTQQMTEDDPNVLYISLHRFDRGSFYPAFVKGAVENVGQGRGEGRTVNIPWQRSNMNDGDYLYAFRTIVMPIAQEFNPSLVIVSAGFDAALGDPIGCCQVTPAGYSQMTHMLMSLANGRVVLALEGGYNLESITNSALACMRVLMGDAPGVPTQVYPSQDCIKTVDRVKAIHRRYWLSLQ